MQEAASYVHVCILIPEENSSGSNNIHDTDHNNHKLMTYIDQNLTVNFQVLKALQYIAHNL